MGGDGGAETSETGTCTIPSRAGKNPPESRRTRLKKATQELLLEKPVLSRPEERPLSRGEKYVCKGPEASRPVWDWSEGGRGLQAVDRPHRLSELTLPGPQTHQGALQRTLVAGGPVVPPPLGPAGCGCPPGRALHQAQAPGLGCKRRCTRTQPSAR